MNSKNVLKIYNQASIFKQSSFCLMELKLNLSEILVRLGLDEKLVSYIKAVNFFNRRIGPELSGNRDLVLRWNDHSGNNKGEKKKRLKGKKKQEDKSSSEDDAIWPSIRQGENLNNRVVLNALEYCYKMGK